MSHHQIGRCASLAAVLLLLALVTSALPVGQSGGGDELESLPEPLRMLLLQRLLETRPGEQRPLSARKRTCLINAGLSHGCDYKDLVGALQEANYWNSALSPGRRRRAATALPIADGPANEMTYEKESGDDALPAALSLQKTASFGKDNTIKRAIKGISRNL